MRRIFLGLAALAASCTMPAWAQMHAVKKPDQVVRAVAVYEWTGEEGKPTASRVVPVSLFIDGQFQDAAIYLARPVPFALDTGTVYEVRKAGVDAGTLELVYERHLTSGDTAEIDDGWLGYGQFKVKPKETLVARNTNRPVSKLVVSGSRSSDSGGPKLVSRSGSTGDSGSSSGSKSSGTAASSAPATKGASTTASADADDDDSNGPTLHRRAGGAGDATTTASTGTPAGTGAAATPAPADTASGDTASDASSRTTTTASSRSSASSTDSEDDADRPTLKRRTPSEIKANKKQRDAARVVAGNDLNDDPDRPTLHRGSKTMSDEEEVPPLRGTPKDMKQLVAVSDARDRPEHEFLRPWQSEGERAEVLGKMQAFAREQLAGYKGVGPAVAASTPAPAASSRAASSKTTSSSRATTAAQRAAKRKAAAAAAAAATVPPLSLDEESLKGYTLSYGGAATYVYTATSPGANGVSRYVAVVAQEEPTVGLKVALASVTDSSHLDRTPWMRFVDVVDADASNRASMLMELRAQHTRQFALYRVIGAQADQVFLSGSTE